MSFVDNDSLDLLESVLTQIHPMEVVLNDHDRAAVVKVEAFVEGKDLLCSKKRMPCSAEPSAALSKLERLVDFK